MGEGSPTADGHTRILIVDDERMNRALLEAALSHGGYAWTSAEDGLAAWDILDAAPTDFAAILLDQNMPRMNGLQLLARIKADERLTHLPVVMQTAYASPDDIVEGISAGVSYYLAKPLNIKLLMTVVAQVVRDHDLLCRLRGDIDRQTAALTLLDSAVFRFRTPDEANMLAIALAYSSPCSRNLAVGLSEIFTNAVEHGNLAIGHDEKSRLLNEQRWSEEIARRLALPEYAGRWVTVEVQRQTDEIRFTVRDQGTGFDWNKYLTFDPGRAFSYHGRGIAMARKLYFDDLSYRGCGNEVVCTVRAAGGLPLPPGAAAVRQQAGDTDDDTDDDMVTASAMQAGLLPAATSLAEIEAQTGLRISSLYRPFATVSGDIWGVEPLDEHRLAIYLADFSSHGMAAALHGFHLHTLIKSMGGDRDRPATVLARLNQKMTGFLPVGHYCAMIYGVLDVRESRFTYAAAAAMRPVGADLNGHRVWSGDGKGLPVGILPTAAYVERQIPLPPGAMLFLFSDGLSEARQSDGKPIGCSGVSASLGAALKAGGETDAAALVGAILTRAGGGPHLRDDLTAICCRRAAE